MKSTKYSAEKIAASAQRVSDLFNKREIDDSAESCEEIALKNNVQIFLVRKQMRAMVASGKVEQVWKHGSRQLIPAYRFKK